MLSVGKFYFWRFESSYFFRLKCGNCILIFFKQSHLTGKNNPKAMKAQDIRNDTLIKFAFIRRYFIFQQGKKPACRQAGVDNAGHWRGFLTL